MFRKNVSFLLCLFSLFILSEGAIVTASGIQLPKTVDRWSRPGLPRLVNAENIFDYMNGAGELYLSYRFRSLEVFEYVSETDPKDHILVELYLMETPDDAFGLLSLDWEGQPINFGGSTAETGRSPTSPIRAIYGAGLLRIWSENVYARVLAAYETPESKNAVLTLGRAIVEKRQNPAEPELLKFLPTLVGSAWKLRRDRLCFLRSYLVLNTNYYISHENILDLDRTTNAVTVPYEHLSAGNERRRCQLLLVKYQNHENALKALQHFHEAYLPEQKKDFPADSTAGGPSTYELEDSWLAYKILNDYIAFVFDSPDEESARVIIRNIETNLVE